MRVSALVVALLSSAASCAPHLVLKPGVNNNGDGKRVGYPAHEVAVLEDAPEGTTTVVERTEDTTAVDAVPALVVAMIYKQQFQAGEGTGISVASSCVNLSSDWNSKTRSMIVRAGYTCLFHANLGCPSAGPYLKLGHPQKDIIQDVISPLYDQRVRAVFCAKNTVSAAHDDISAPASGLVTREPTIVATIYKQQDLRGEVDPREKTNIWASTDCMNLDQRYGNWDNMTRSLTVKAGNFCRFHTAKDCPTDMDPRLTAGLYFGAGSPKTDISYTFLQDLFDQSIRSIFCQSIPGSHPFLGEDNNFGGRDMTPRVDVAAWLWKQQNNMGDIVPQDKTQAYVSSFCANLDDIYGNWDQKTRSMTVSPGFKCQFFVERDCLVGSQRLEVGDAYSAVTLAALAPDVDIRIRAYTCLRTL